MYQVTTVVIHQKKGNNWCSYLYILKQNYFVGFYLLLLFCIFVDHRERIISTRSVCLQRPCFRVDSSHARFEATLRVVFNALGWVRSIDNFEFGLLVFKASSKTTRID